MGPGANGERTLIMSSRHTLETLAAISLAACILFGAMATGEALLLSAASDANRAQPTALMCFDKAGHPTLGDHFAECRRVHYRVER